MQRVDLDSKKPTTFLLYAFQLFHHFQTPEAHTPSSSSTKTDPIEKNPLLQLLLKTLFDHQNPAKSPQKPISRTTQDSMDSNSNSSHSNTIPVFSTLTSPFESSPHADDVPRKPLSLWPGMYHSPVTNALWEARSNIFEILLDPPVDAPPQSQLLTKTPFQSRTTILYNFSTDYILREQYRDPWNEVRIGKLLEDLDALAGTISVKHCSDDDSMTRPLLLVTASVDKMVLKKPISVDVDLKMVGAVIWVGRSSIEIQLEVTQPTNGCLSSLPFSLCWSRACLPIITSKRAPQRSHSSPTAHIDFIFESILEICFAEESSDALESIALTANFIFVARDSKTGKAAPVNRLSPETEQEKLLYEEAEARKLKKRKRGYDRKEIENGEVDRLKSLLAEGRIFCDMPALADRNTILLRDTRLENSLICHPQQRNIHGRIFGGFLMHRAFELAFSTAYVFAGMMPCFLEVDHVDFLRPVDVGDLLRLTSCVLYTELETTDQPLINVEVVAHVTRPELRSSEVSNTFYFSFTVHPEVNAMKNEFRIRKVVPATEEEARRVLERMDAESLQLAKNINK
ncbi:acyl-coenzyme A thioesterase 9, mitochondrial-like isoform X1 [Camellia sinensis]|uniref:acyl-coenzyme A thioesterase 9, mitochondrial-like isoform X1 n=1 Tax=Camellia sinensis TaxID=4442 RepID=UPI0010369E19|nr:acyl-coenzyme A thioesterase 9, mitochondrial-like isoform X1 [Camellia sinensis]